MIEEQLDNVSNGNKTSGCCQLEITTKQRQDFFVDGEWSRSKRSGCANWTLTLFCLSNCSWY
ncbi:poly-gamma-glutamate hydrolase family protein [Priestia aryabhattai]|uniref:poly-gamma-glutamate hydrolase family protein n=1 Tax=Priestia aryabhattai TaxID=412384 RepID=UPI0035572F9A